MELKNYLKRKPQFFIVLGLSLILSSCSTSRDFNSNNDITDAAQKTNYQDYFDEKVKDYETSLNYDDLYFTDLNTYRSNYFTGRSLFGNYQYTGFGNRFNNVTIDNYGINIYSPLSELNIARTNWAWTSNQLESWGWMNKGWNTPWNQNGWRSISNSWNGPIWNYWGWDGDSRTFSIIAQNQLQTRYSLDKRFAERLGKRQSVYLAFNNRSSNNTKNNTIRYASLTKRTSSDKPRSRPRTKTVIRNSTSTLSNSYVSTNNSTIQSDSRSNTRSTIRRSNNSNSTTNSSTIRTTSSAIKSVSNSNTIGRSAKSLRN